LCALKQAGRRLERLSRKSGLTGHAEAYKLNLSTYRDALCAARSTYFSNIINSSNKNSRTLFSTVSKLLQPPAPPPVNLPTATLKPGSPNLPPLTLPISENSSFHPRLQLTPWILSSLFSSKPACSLSIYHTHR
ncbi:unnamed protein product, partial [Coregonus sp. 'balchen']